MRIGNRQNPRQKAAKRPSRKAPLKEMSSPDDLTNDSDNKRKVGRPIEDDAHPPQSGILSCFFHGFSSCLFLSFLSPIATRRRVECGMITSSMKPLLAATKGLAKRSSYSRVFSAIFAGSSASLRKMISTAPFAPITAISAVGQA